MAEKKLSRTERANERKRARLRQAQPSAPDGTKPVFSHHEIIYVPVRQPGEETIGKSGFTDRQLDVIEEHGKGVRARKRAAEPKRLRPLFDLD